MRKSKWVTLHPCRRRPVWYPKDWTYRTILALYASWGSRYSWWAGATVGTHGPLTENNSFHRCCGRDKNRSAIPLIIRGETQVYWATASSFQGGKRAAFVTDFLSKPWSKHSARTFHWWQLAFHSAQFPSFRFSPCTYYTSWCRSIS